MINIIAVDKIKEKYIRQGIDIYSKRLTNHLKIKEYEINPEKYHLQNDITNAKSVESNKIINIIQSQNLYHIALDETGTLVNSTDFSSLIYDILNHKHIAFSIGGAYGHSKELLQSADKIISFSKMTFTHEMIRLFLYEQIYRAYTIFHNKKYHN